MMSQIYGLCLFILGLLILFGDHTKRICAIIIAIACFNGATFGPFTMPQLVSICCLVAMTKEYGGIRCIKDNISYIKISGLIATMVFAFIPLALNAPYRQGVLGFLALVFKEWICTYFYLFYGILCFKGKDIDGSAILKTIIVCLLLLTGTGVVNLVTRQSVFVNMFLLNDSLGTRENMYMYSDRFRVQSMFHNPFDYGYICVLFSLILWHMKQLGHIKKGTLFIGLLCAFFGVLMCNCRTVLYVFGLSFVCNLLITEDVPTKLKYLLTVFIGILVVSSFIPSIGKYVDYVLSVFDEKSIVGGSSMEMRNIQFATTLYYIKDNLWFGLGENYYFYNFWENGSGTTDLLGLEGVHFKYLLERGIVGLGLYILYYLLLLRRLFVIRDHNRMLAGLSMSVIVAYLSFSVMTGELSSLTPSLFIAGAMLGQSCKEYCD